MFSVHGSGGGCFVKNENSHQHPCATDCFFMQCSANDAGGLFWMCGKGRLTEADSALFFGCRFESNYNKKLVEVYANDAIIFDSNGVISEPKNIFSQCFTNSFAHSSLFAKANDAFVDISSTLIRIPFRAVGGPDAADKDDLCGAAGQLPCESIFFAINQKFPKYRKSIHVEADMLMKETRTIVLEFQAALIEGQSPFKNIIDTTQGLTSDSQSATQSLFLIKDAEAQFRTLTFFINESSWASTSMTLFEVSSAKRKRVVSFQGITITTKLDDANDIHSSSSSSCVSSNYKYQILRPLLLSTTDSEYLLHNCNISHLSFDRTSFFARSNHTGTFHLDNCNVVCVQRADSGSSGAAASFVSDTDEVVFAEINQVMKFENSSFESCGNRNSMKGGVICTTSDNKYGCYFLGVKFTSCFCSNGGSGGAAYIDLSMHGTDITSLALITFNLVQSSSNTAKHGPLAFLLCKDYRKQLNDILFPLDAAKIEENLAIAAMDAGESEVVDVIRLFAYTRLIYVYVSSASEDNQDCGEISNPCYSLTKGVNHLSLTEYGSLCIIDNTTLTSDIRLTNSGLTQRDIGSSATVFVNSTVLSYVAGLAVFECSVMTQMQRLIFSFSPEFGTSHSIFIRMKEGDLMLDSCEFSSDESSSENVLITPILIQTLKGKLFATNIHICDLLFQSKLFDLNPSTIVNLTSTRIYNVSFKKDPNFEGIIEIERLDYPEGDDDDRVPLTIDHLEMVNVDLFNWMAIKIYSPNSSGSLSLSSSRSGSLVNPSSSNGCFIKLSSLVFNKVDAGPRSEGLIYLMNLYSQLSITSISIKDCSVNFNIGCAVNIQKCNVLIDQGEFSEIRHHPEEQHETERVEAAAFGANADCLIIPSSFLLKPRLHSVLFSDLSESIANNSVRSPCDWKTGALYAFLSNQVKLINVSFQRCSVGGLYVLKSRVSIDDCSFSLNSPKFEGFPSALHNIRCVEGSLLIDKLKSGDGVETGSSLWMQRESCNVTGAAIKEELPLFFRPALNSVEYVSTRVNPTIVFKGEKLIPCNLTFEVNYTSNSAECSKVFEFSKHMNETYAEGEIPQETFSEMDKDASVSVTLLYWKTEEQQERVQVFMLSASKPQKTEAKFPVWAIAVIACVSVALVAVSAIAVRHYTKKLKKMKEMLALTEPMMSKGNYSMNTMSTLTSSTTQEFKIPFDSQEPWMED